MYFIFSSEAEIEMMYNEWKMCLRRQIRIRLKIVLNLLVIELIIVKVTT